MEREVLMEIVEDGRRRLRARRAWLWGGRIGLALGGAGLVLALARTIFPLEFGLVVLIAAAPLAGLLAVAALRALLRVSPLVAAQVLDLRFACADRLATAVELVTGRLRPTRLDGALLADAAAAASGLDLKRTLRAGPGRIWLGVLVVLAAGLAGTYGLSGLAIPGTPAHDIVQTIRREGRRLERTANTVEEQARLDRARVARRAAPQLRRLGETLQRERLERQEALARIQELTRQIEAERRRVQARTSDLQGGQSPRRDPNLPSELFRRRAAADRALRQIQEIADRLLQSRSPEEREALMRQLAALAAGGDDGDVPVRARDQVAQAQRQMAAGDAAGARRTLQQAATDLDDLRALLADEEGLQQAHRTLENSAENISRGRPAGSADGEETPQASAQPGEAAPGSRPLPQTDSPSGAEPPPGPNQGTTPGQGNVVEKLGERTARLEVDRQQQRLRGLQGQGRSTTSDILGPGRQAQVRRPPAPAAGPAARASADRYMTRLRIPPEYREIVRRYFEALAGQR